MTKHSALLVGAGAGIRLKSDKPKAFVPIAGKPLLYWTCTSLARWPNWHEWVCMVPDGYENAAREILQAVRGIHWPVSIRVGGETRQESTNRGLLALQAPTYVWVHDVARPFVSLSLIERMYEKLKRGIDSVIPVVGLTGTIKRVQGNRIIETVNRSSLRMSQTPQVADADDLRNALKLCASKNIEVTDEAQALEIFGKDIGIVDGDPWNIKITFPEDLQLAEWISSWFFTQKD